MSAFSQLPLVASVPWSIHIIYDIIALLGHPLHGVYQRDTPHKRTLHHHHQPEESIHFLTLYKWTDGIDATVFHESNDRLSFKCFQMCKFIPDWFRVYRYGSHREASWIAREPYIKHVLKVSHAIFFGICEARKRKRRTTYTRVYIELMILMEFHLYGVLVNSW